MTDILNIHPQSPQPRLIKRAVAAINNGAVIAYPTDSAYALGCHIGDKKALDTIRQIRQLPKQHNFTLVCVNLADLSLYAKVNNTSYRIIKKLTPGPYTFIFTATKEVPKRLQQQQRKTIGLRIPDHKIVTALLTELNQPIMSVSLILPNSDLPLNNADEIYAQLKSQIDLVISGGSCTIEPTTVVDFTSDEAVIRRSGQGDTSFFS